MKYYEKVAEITSLLIKEIIEFRSQFIGSDGCVHDLHRHIFNFCNEAITELRQSKPYDINHLHSTVCSIRLNPQNDAVQKTQIQRDLVITKITVLYDKLLQISNPIHI